MTSSLILAFGDEKHQLSAAGSGTDAVRFFRNLEDVEVKAQEKLGVQPGTYDLYDRYGMIRHQKDLMRALETSVAGEVLLELREHLHFTRIRGVEAEEKVLAHKLDKLERSLQDSEDRTTAKIEEAKADLTSNIVKVDNRISNDVIPLIETAQRDLLRQKQQTNAVQEKLGKINLTEIADMCEKAESLGEELRAALDRMDKLDEEWTADKSQINETTLNVEKAMAELRRYMEGKIQVCIQTDADLREDQQKLDERVELLVDEVKLLEQKHKRLEKKCEGTLEESEELRTTLGRLREDNAYVKKETGQVRTRVHCIEGTSTERWQDFSNIQDDVQFFRHWHRLAKGSDVQLSTDFAVATGRGFLAATGMVLTNDEGLVVGDGPCRRFGTPGQWSSYFEVQLDEVCAAPESAGGLYVGIALQSAQEIAAHPKHEFDGWLIGGHAKALVCRAGTGGGVAIVADGALPATWAQAAKDPATKESAAKAVQMLRNALPMRAKGECRELRSMWASHKLHTGDKIGVLFRFNREGGARMKITVNGDLTATHDFAEAPPADAVGYLTPVVRLAGTGKSARLLPGLHPPARIIAG